ncbi:hypothetical protein METBIDRAFT_31459 [Metschnikowia bicuspidata var. bicuspidata NRRL YB-4993]|uniref:Uncharacterized protein n=1 Tax=Metschnikowia bicuspidata var. bicuspidata NRRL YB-4993 TaxID=869754 RepID=A0A1A0HFA7_9ASCO|nr:hypothetical protein METBIDRAFT_31459 [Metschnikowia bicuspidata var. bicuspidata NRRL YB-4993]OBA22577.1 hypothetical protein METBIDRAFT_31459 [Metschnikowia bicuspidata var. bicuspidata NRRL YB-4993]
MLFILLRLLSLTSFHLTHISHCLTYSNSIPHTSINLTSSMLFHSFSHCTQSQIPFHGVSLILFCSVYFVSWLDRNATTISKRNLSQTATAGKSTCRQATKNNQDQDGVDKRKRSCIQARQLITGRPKDNRPPVSRTTVENTTPANRTPSGAVSKCLIPIIPRNQIFQRLISKTNYAKSHESRKPPNYLRLHEEAPTTASDSIHITIRVVKTAVMFSTAPSE